MTRDEAWTTRCREYAAFVEANHRCPSRHHLEEHTLHSWWKHTRKLLNAGKLNPQRKAMFNELMAFAESYRHINQYR